MLRLRALVLMGPLTCLLLGVAGCRQEATVVFEPNLVHAMKYQIKEGIDMQQASSDAHWIVTEMFGTPNDPKLPAALTEDEELASIVSMDNLVKASGDPAMEGRGLYRKHCVLCHGIAGDGRGTSAAILNPYPRDYRRGIFKFKSTARGAKPLHEDLHGLIANGIPGSAMVKIPGLTDEDVDALVDYTIYLSMRGELERTLIDDAIFELDLEGGDRIIDPLAANADEESEERELFDEGWEIAEDYVLEISEAWLEAPDEVVDVPTPPTEIPVPDSHQEFIAALEGPEAGALSASIETGHKIFIGRIASCSKCHGEKGLGDGQTTDYDDWIKEWTMGIGIKPEDREALTPLLARGALPPINAKPRNFALGAFHGGSGRDDLYRRIQQGIEGSPMPAATFVSGQFEEDDIWHLINYIRSLQDTPEEEGDAQDQGVAAALDEHADRFES